MSTRIERLERTVGHRRCKYGSESRESRRREARRREPKRLPLLRFGPGLLIAIIASVLVWTRMPRQPGPPPAPSGPPQVIHESPGAPVALPSAPDPAWIIEHAGVLELTPIEAAKIAKLKARWDRDTKDLRADLDAAHAAYERQMQENAGKPMTMRQMQEAGAPVSQLSRQLAAARQAWWSEAAMVLTQEQRRKAEEMWAARFQQTSGPANQEVKTPR